MTDPRDETHFCKCGGDCPNCADTVPTGTDRVELTKDENERLERAVTDGFPVVTGKAYNDLLHVVESIVAARVAALTAERDELEHDLNNEAWANEKAKRDLDAARAELARDAYRDQSDEDQKARGRLVLQLDEVEAERDAARAEIERLREELDRAYHFGTDSGL